MTTPIQRATLEESLERLRLMDEFKVLVEFLRQERESMFMDFCTLEGENAIMKHTGGIARLDEVIRLME